MQSKEIAMIKIYTDGGCKPNPGQGGWAFIVIDGFKRYIRSGYEKDTTNNRMELLAAIEALKTIIEHPQWKNKIDRDKISVYSDSEYLINGSKKYDKWLLLTKTKNNVLTNADLWTMFKAYQDIVNADFVKVEGHSNDKYNNLCDKEVGIAIARKKNTTLRRI